MKKNISMVAAFIAASAAVTSHATALDHSLNYAAPPEILYANAFNCYDREENDPDLVVWHPNDDAKIIPVILTHANSSNEVSARPQMAMTCIEIPGKDSKMGKDSEGEESSNSTTSTTSGDNSGAPDTGPAVGNTGDSSTPDSNDKTETSSAQTTETNKTLPADQPSLNDILKTPETASNQTPAYNGDDFSKLDSAYKAIQEAEPASDFYPTDPNQLAPDEQLLKDTLQTLQSIPTRQEDLEAEKQTDEYNKSIIDHAEELALGLITGDLDGKTTAEILYDAIKPAQTTEGIAGSRDRLITAIETRLDQYQMRRDIAAGKRLPLVLSFDQPDFNMPYTGPSLRAPHP